jgi:hypothetical protein
MFKAASKRRTVDRRELLQGWYALIQDYRLRSLTYDTDVLPALAGIATAISETHKLHYLNGIWEEDLPLALLWFVDSRKSKLPTSEVEEPKPPATLPVFPSWSWASSWGQRITFESWRAFATKIYPRLRIMFQAQLIHPLHQDQYETEHGQLHHEAQNHDFIYQQVSNTAISIEGFVRDLVVELDDTRVKQDKRIQVQEENWKRIVLDAEDQSDVGYIALDFDPVQLRVANISTCLCQAFGRLPGQRSVHSYP